MKTWTKVKLSVAVWLWLVSIGLLIGGAAPAACTLFACSSVWTLL
jgi:hypothetical protein